MYEGFETRQWSEAESALDTTVHRILNIELGVGDLAKETSNQTVLKLPSGFILLLIVKCERQYIS